MALCGVRLPLQVKMLGNLTLLVNLDNWCLQSKKKKLLQQVHVIFKFMYYMKLNNAELYKVLGLLLAAKL